MVPLQQDAQPPPDGGGQAAAACAGHPLGEILNGHHLVVAAIEQGLWFIPIEVVEAEVEGRA